MVLSQLIKRFTEGAPPPEEAPTVDGQPVTAGNIPQDGEVVGKHYTRTGQCNQCGKCCTNIYLVYNQRTVMSVAEFEKLRQFEPEYKYFTPLDETEHGVRFQCRHLKLDNSCAIYGERPTFCKLYPSEHGIMLGAELATGCGYSFKPNVDFKNVLSKAAKR